MAEIRDQVADLLQDGWEAWRRRRGPRPPRGRDPAHVASQGEKRTRLYLDREKASQSFFGALSLTTKKMRTYPIQGDQNAEQTRPHDRSSGARDRLGKEDRGHPGQRQAPPHQGPDRPLRLRPGAKAHHTHLYAPPLRPRHWVPPRTYGTPPGTISPTPVRSPRRTPSRPSPPTLPTAPSTTTSSTDLLKKFCT